MTAPTPEVMSESARNNQLFLQNQELRRIIEAKEAEIAWLDIQLDEARAGNSKLNEAMVEQTRRNHQLQYDLDLLKR